MELSGAVAARASSYAETDLLYVSGVIDRPGLLMIPFSPQFVPNIYQDIGEKNRVNQSTLAAFRDLQSAEKAPGKPSIWEQSSVKDMFTGVFAAVESDQILSKYVGSPNNVRVITTCGRLKTTVEGNWPTCPSSKAPVTTRKQKPSSKGKGTKQSS
jgi:hypothetical protein